MHWDRIKANWQPHRARILHQWGRLTDEDLDAIDGERQVLSGRIQEAYGISKDEAERQIRRFEEILGKEDKDTAARSERRTDSHVTPH